MKANLKTLAVAACLAISTCAYAQVGFLRPEFSYSFARLDGSDAAGFKVEDSLGYGIAGGYVVGAQNEHEFGISLATTDFNLSANVGTASATGKVKVVPVLANYRYYLGTKTDAARCYLAPSVGSTSIKTTTSVVSGITTVNDSSSGTCFTWAAGIGVLFKVDDKIDVDLGYRYVGGLKVKETNIKAKVGMLYLAGNFRF